MSAAVDCSQAGEGYEYMDPMTVGGRKLLSVSPGCDLLHGEGPLAYVSMSMRERITLSSFPAAAL